MPRDHQHTLAMAPRAPRHFRIVHVSDTHLGLDWPVRPRIDRPRRGADFFNNFERVLQHALDTEADAVIHTGDVFFRSKLPPSVVDKAYAIFAHYAGRGLPIVVLPGNHERSQMPPSLLLRHPNIHTLDGPRAVRLQTDRGSFEVVGFPYQKDARAALPDLLGQIPSTGADVSLLAVHQALEDAWVGPSREEGVRFERQPDVIAKDSVPDRFCAVLAGHIHRRQVIRMGARANIPGIHCGSVERTSAQELPEPKGFVELFIDQRLGERASVRPVFRPLPARRWNLVKLDETLSTPDALAQARHAVREAGSRTYVQLRPALRHLEAISAARLHREAGLDVVVEVRPLTATPARTGTRRTSPTSAASAGPASTNPAVAPAAAAASASSSAASPLRSTPAGRPTIRYRRRPATGSRASA